MIAKAGETRGSRTALYFMCSALVSSPVLYIDLGQALLVFTMTYAGEYKDKLKYTFCMELNCKCVYQAILFDV